MLVLLNNITGVWKLDWRIDTAELTQIPVISDNQLTFIQVYIYIHPGIYIFIQVYIYLGLHPSRYTFIQVYIHPGIHPSWYTFIHLYFLLSVHSSRHAHSSKYTELPTKDETVKTTWNSELYGNLKVKKMFCLKFILIIAF